MCSIIESIGFGVEKIWIRMLIFLYESCEIFGKLFNIRDLVILFVEWRGYYYFFYGLYKGLFVCKRVWYSVWSLVSV